MVSFSSYIGNSRSNLKEHPKSNPRVNQNKTRMSNYGLEALYSQQGRKKYFQFFTPPMPPPRQLLSTNLRMWDTCSLSKIMELLDHLCSLSDILNDLPFLWGEASLHSNALISLSKARGLQLQWSNFKHIER